MALVFVKVGLAVVLALAALVGGLDSARAQEPPEPTPTPAPITSIRNITVSATSNVVGYVYPNGVAMWILRWNISAGDAQITNRYPLASSVVTFALTPATASHATGQEVIIRPAVVPGTTGPGARGWGQGLGIGVCHCFRGLDSADQAAELALDWTLVTELNPEYVVNPSMTRRAVQLNGFLEIDDYAAPESAVRASIAAVNADQPAALLNGRFLAQTGEIYLASYSLELVDLLPSLYTRGAQSVPIPTPGTFEGVAIPVAGMDDDASTDNPVEMALDGMQEFTGMTLGDVTGLAWAGFALALTVAAGVVTRNAVFPVCVLVFVLLGGVAFGWTPLWVAAIIMGMSAITLGWVLWLKKGVGA